VTGILSYGTYLPLFRLDRKLIGEAFQGGGGRGTRSVAGHDEDTTTFGVAASRRAVQPLGGAGSIATIWFASTEPPYLDKTNATAIHDAIAAADSAGAYDVNGAVRSGIGALRAGLAQPEPSLVVLSDMRSGMPGGTDEANGGDGAAALVVGPATGEHEVLAELLATASQSTEFLDRWREPTAGASKSWEDRFGEQILAPLATTTLTSALEAAKVELAEVDHLIVVGSHDRAVRGLAKKLGAKARGRVEDPSSSVGNAGTAQLGLQLAAALDGAEPGQVIAALHVADGADALVFRVTDALLAWRERRATAADVTIPISYATYLLWRKQLHREPPRRPDPDVPVAPAAYRDRQWKFAFRGTRCDVCGTVHLPPQRVCASCGAADQMTPEPISEATGTIFTVTADHLAFSEAPPMAVAIVDLNGGGRVQCELTDLAGELPSIGSRVEMTFRRAYTVNGIHNYVWKARPIPTASSDNTAAPSDNTEEAHG
jgi:hydroxymethylglutaryl-CoA synthase